jgi:hypothetical protein
MDTRTVLCAVAAIASAAPAYVAAQNAPPQPPATIALVPALPDTASRAIVLRRVGGGDVILLREADASADDLAAAIAALARSRAVDGATLANTLRMRIQSATPVGATPRGLLERLGQALRQIRGSPTLDVPGLGPARTGTIPMTPFRDRQR